MFPAKRWCFSRDQRPLDTLYQDKCSAGFGYQGRACYVQHARHQGAQGWEYVVKEYDTDWRGILAGSTLVADAWLVDA